MQADASNANGAYRSARGRGTRVRGGGGRVYRDLRAGGAGNRGAPRRSKPADNHDRDTPCFAELFHRGSCRNGEQCPRSHSSDILTKVRLAYNRPEPCRFEITRRGSCRRGRACLYSHDPTNFDFVHKLWRQAIAETSKGGSFPSVFCEHCLESRV